MSPSHFYPEIPISIPVLVNNMGKYAAVKYIWLCAEQILSVYEVQYPYSMQKCEVDSCPTKMQFYFWPSAISVVAPWLWGWRSEYRIIIILECRTLELFLYARLCHSLTFYIQWLFIFAKSCHVCTDNDKEWFSSPVDSSINTS